jgi:hypothetical protein
MAHGVVTPSVHPRQSPARLDGPIKTVASFCPARCVIPLGKRAAATVQGEQTKARRFGVSLPERRVYFVHVMIHGAALQRRG